MLILKSGGSEDMTVPGAISSLDSDVGCHVASLQTDP